MKKEITCPRCDGDGLEMCRIDGCDYDPERKCIDCKGSGKITVENSK